MTEVLHGEQNVISTVLKFTSNAKVKIDACIDSTRPSLIRIEQLKKAFLDAKDKGVKLRYITEVTEENVDYCKELLKLVDDLHHLKGIKGNFYISEIEYIAPATSHTEGKPASQIIYSNVMEIVEHHQHYVFDSFWNSSVPATQRIKEIEDKIVNFEDKLLNNAVEQEPVIFSKKEEKFLLENQGCRIATSYNDVPHIVPVSYIYDRGFFFFATDYKTKKYKNLERNSNIGLLVDIYESSSDNTAVSVQGSSEFIAKGEEFRHLYDLFKNKFDWVRQNPWREGEAPFVKVKPISKVSWGLD
jgi:nitroimidazol reductase NimA-like FMN-containing flavoprotein (pyridoxamine 5'-phosphate oxidase superfamily)